MERLHALYARLVEVHPLAPWLALTLAIWALVYAVRRWFPDAWKRLESAVPEGVGVPISNILLALPSVAFGAAWAAFTSGEVSPGMAFGGAVAGALAPVFHHLLKWLPLPYQGPVRDAVWRKVAKYLGRTSLLFLLIGCAPNPTDESQRIIDRWSCLDKAESDWRERARKLCPLPEDCQGKEEDRSEYCLPPARQVAPTWSQCPHSKELEAALKQAQERCS